MGISYSAVKTNAPEAFDIGKDYYGLTDLFPACAYQRDSDSLMGKLLVKMFVPSIDDVQHLVGSRHMVGPTVFAVSDYYQTADEMLDKIVELKKRPMDAFPLDIEIVKNLRAFFVWAGSDPIQFIAELDELDDRDATDEYQLCGPISDYRYVNAWNGEAGRKVVDYSCYECGHDLSVDEREQDKCGKCGRHYHDDLEDYDGTDNED